jgi:mono/diheme cytochrome c family protein
VLGHWLKVCPKGEAGLARFARSTPEDFMKHSVLGLFCLLGLALATPALAQDAKTIERGQAVYAEQKCSLCHAIEGKGNKQHPLDGIGSKLSAADIRKWITDPKSMEASLPAKPKIPMKAYPNLKAEDLDALVAYLGSLKKS